MTRTAVLALAVWAFPVLGAAAGVARAAVPAKPPAARSTEVVVARVDGRSITLSDLLFRFAQLPDDVRRGYEARPRALRDFLRDVVANEEVLAAARAARVEKDPVFARLLDLRRSEVMLDVYARRTVASSIDEAALRARYEVARGRFELGPLVHLHYALATAAKEKTVFNEAGDDAVGDEPARAKAERLRAAIVAGKDFAAVARRLSEDESARAGGDLGWVDPASLVAEVGKVATTLPVGEVSAVLASPLGYHVVQVVERRDPGALPFEAVRELLLQEAIAEKREDLAAKALEERARLEKQGKVEVFEELLP